MSMDMAQLGMTVDSSQVRTATTDTHRFGEQGKKTSKTIDTATAGMATNLRRVRGAVTGIIAAAASLGAITSLLGSYDRQMSKVGAVSRATGEEMVKLRKIAADLGSTTEFTAVQAGEGLEFLARAGFSAAEAMQAIPAVLDLATAASMGLGQAADISSNIMSGFGLSASRASEVADVLAAASSRANTDVGQLGQAMSTVAPISKTVGISLGDTAAAIGVMSDAGIQGERAGTAMRGVLASLVGPTKQARDALSRYGLTSKDVNPEMRSLADVMETLRDKNLSTADAMTIFGREAASGAFVLMDSADRLREFGTELENVEGEAKRMADMIRDNLGGSLDGMWSSLQGVVIAMGEAGLIAAIRGVIDGITLLLRGLSSAITFVANLGGELDRVGAYLLAGAAIVTAMYTPAIIAATLAMGKFIASLVLTRTALLRTGLGIVVVAAGELVFWLSKVVGAAGGVGEAFKRVYAVGEAVFLGIGNTAWGLMDILAGVASSIVGSFVAAFAQIARAWDMLINGLGSAFEAITGKTVGVSDASGKIGALADGLMDQATASINQGGARIKAAGAAVAEAAKAAVAPIEVMNDTMDDGAAAATKLADALDGDPIGTGGSGKSKGLSAAAKEAAKSAKELADRIEELEFAADPVKKYNKELSELNKLLDAGLSEGAYSKELQKMNDALADQIPMVNDVASAWGDFVVSGFKDFEDFTKKIWNSFKGLLSDMIATAARNKILISLGVGAGSTASGAAAGGVGGGGGLLGSVKGLLGGSGGGGTGLLGSIGSLGSAFASGFGNTIAATFGAGGGLMSGIASAGAQVGTALAGGSIASIGAAIGAVAPYALLAFGAFKLLKGAFKRTHASTGFEGLVGGSGLLSGAQIDHFKGSTFKSGKTTRTALPADMSAGINAAVASIRSSTVEMAESLGLATNAVDSFAAVSFGYGFADGTFDQSQMDAAIQGALNQVADRMARTVFNPAVYAKAGERADEVLQRLAVSLTGVNAVFSAMDKTLLDVSLTGAAAASRLVDAFGSLEVLAAVSADYYQNFYSEAERAAKVTRDLTGAFADLGFELPASREGFRALVDGIDVTTQAGANLYASVLGLSGSLSTILPAFDAVSDATRKLVHDLLNDADLAATSYAQRGARSDMMFGDAERAAQEGDLTAVREYLRVARAQSSTDLEYRQIASKVLGQIGISPSGSPASATVLPSSQVQDAQAARNDAMELQLIEIKRQLVMTQDENRQLALRADRYLKQIADLAEKNDKIGMPPDRA
jgi:TP901 family phage tail tape measure protein